MSDSTTVKITCYEVGGTPNAMLVSLSAKDETPKRTSAWIPRSQITHISRQPKPGEWSLVTIELPEWLAIKKGLIA